MFDCRDSIYENKIISGVFVIISQTNFTEFEFDGNFVLV